MKVGGVLEDASSVDWWIACVESIGDGLGMARVDRLWMSKLCCRRSSRGHDERSNPRRTSESGRQSEMAQRELPSRVEEFPLSSPTGIRGC